MRGIVAFFIFIIIVFPLTLAALYFLSVNTWLTDGDFYADMLDNEALYEDDIITRLIAMQIAEDVSGDPNLMTERPETITALTQALSAITSEDYPRDEVIASSDALVEYLNGERPDLDISIDLLTIQNTLREPPGAERFVQTMAENLPVCSGGEEPFMGETPLILCRPASMDAETAAEQFNGRLDEFVNVMPDALTVDFNVGFDDVAAAMQIAAVLALLVAGVLLVLTSLVAGRSIRGFVLWAGAFLLLPALVVAMSGVGIQNGLADNVLTVDDLDLDIEGVEPTLEFREALVETITDAAGAVGRGFLVTGGMAVLVALVLMGVGTTLPGRRQDDYDDRNGSVTVP
jgi:hypothetical protein